MNEDEVTGQTGRLMSTKEHIMKMTFPIKALRTVKSPSDPTVTTYFAWTNMRDLPTDMPTKVNPREVNMRTTTAKKLLEAVSGTDPYFDIHNRGMVLLANEVKFDAPNSLITIDFDHDEDRYGVLDGGHTYEAIKERRDQIPEDINKYVKLEIFVGVDLDVAALSDARNTSVQVSDIALFNLEDRFDFIKEGIANEPYGQDIAYKDNEDKRIPIADLLRLMYAFNISRFPDDTSVPVAAYSGKANVFKDYKNEWDKHSSGNQPTTDNIYRRLLPLVPSLVNLYETIELEMAEKYRDYKKMNGTGAKFGSIRGIENTNKDRTEFLQRKKDYNISSGFIMPIYGAFRALLHTKDNGDLDWEFDPIQIWQAIGVTLVQTVFDTDTNPQSVGKSKTLWQAAYRIVENEKNRRLIAKLSQK